MVEPEDAAIGNDPIANHRRVNGFSRKPAGKIGAMAGSNRGRPSLGERATVTATLPLTVRKAAETAARDHHLDLSPYLADLICFHYGRPDLMRHLTQAILFETASRTYDLTTDTYGRHQTIRLPVPVAELVEYEARDRGIQRSTLLADIVCLRMGFPGLIRAIDKEVMPLAI
ncbi:hypothetical protein [Mycolicibacterium wolinskyi]|uniref:hypothetical protein n=1 Tax=Mycolicibacterium wolinskyi TaxID=59750 RepID=UPI000AF80EE4|nr:hypothetical protein [Mycolicibacterium wolinskyi]